MQSTHNSHKIKQQKILLFNFEFTCWLSYIECFQSERTYNKCDYKNRKLRNLRLALCLKFEFDLLLELIHVPVTNTALNLLEQRLIELQKIFMKSNATIMK